MARLIDVLLFFPQKDEVLLFISNILTVGPLLLSLVLLHDLFYAPFHHSKILLGVDVLGLGLVLHVVHLANVPLLLLVAFQAVVDAGGRAWGLVEQGLKS